MADRGVPLSDQAAPDPYQAAPEPAQVALEHVRHALKCERPALPPDRLPLGADEDAMMGDGRALFPVRATLACAGGAPDPAPPIIIGDRDAPRADRPALMADRPVFMPEQSAHIAARAALVSDRAIMAAAESTLVPDRSVIVSDRSIIVSDRATIVSDRSDTCEGRLVVVGDAREDRVVPCSAVRGESVEIRERLLLGELSRRGERDVGLNAVRAPTHARVRVVHGEAEPAEYDHVRSWIGSTAGRASELKET